MTTPPYYEDATVTLHAGDCLDVLRTLPDASVDAVVTDPPYNLSFMAKPWDAYEGREDAGFAYWLSGLIDGEGCFVIKAHARGTHAPMFRLKLRDDEAGTIRLIHRTVGIGTITNHKPREGSQSQETWDVQDKAGCQALVDLLDKYPLRAKKQIDYWTWREAVCEWTSRPRGNRWHGRADNTRMESLRGRLMEGRAYTDVPWSGHEFQDWCRLWGAECLRVLKPGGHLLSFGGTRTSHRLTAGLEDAGFEIRDSIAWLYGSGFPKSLDVSKAIDKARDDRDAILNVTTFMANAAERHDLSRADVDAHMGTSDMGGWWLSRLRHRCACPTPEQYLRLKELLDLPDDLDDEVMRLNGRKGTLGEAWDQREKVGEGHRIRRESVVQIAGLSDGPYDITAPATPDAERWQGWGTALKPAHEPIVVARKPLTGTVSANVLQHGTGALNVDGCRVGDEQRLSPPMGNPEASYGGYSASVVRGRWPANVVLDESQAEALDQQSGTLTSGANPTRRGSDKFRDAYGDFAGQEECEPARGVDIGGASRFFYTAKADAGERVRIDGIAHPTVKPLALMRWLVRLVTPPGGTVLEPFAGSGTTVEACILEGFRCIAIEREPDYLPLIVQRINRRRDPVAAVRDSGEDGGLFDLLGEEPA